MCSVWLSERRRVAHHPSLTLQASTTVLWLRLKAVPSLKFAQSGFQFSEANRDTDHEDTND
jgi:hypothetical protein